jgi:hypothetical protein
MLEKANQEIINAEKIYLKVKLPMLKVPKNHRYLEFSESLKNKLFTISKLRPIEFGIYNGILWLEEIYLRYVN